MKMVTYKIIDGKMIKVEETDSEIIETETIEEPVYEDRINQEKYEAYVKQQQEQYQREAEQERQQKQAEANAEAKKIAEQKQAELETEYKKASEKKQVELIKQQTEERKRSTIKEKLIGAVTTTTNILTQSLAKKREERYQKRQEKIKETKQQELDKQQKEIQERKTSELQKEQERISQQKQSEFEKADAERKARYEKQMKLESEKFKEKTLVGTKTYDKITTYTKVKQEPSLVAKPIPFTQSFMSIDEYKKYLDDFNKGFKETTPTQEKQPTYIDYLAGATPSIKKTYPVDTKTLLIREYVAPTPSGYVAPTIGVQKYGKVLYKDLPSLVAYESAEKIVTNISYDIPKTISAVTEASLDYGRGVVLSGQYEKVVLGTDYTKPIRDVPIIQAGGYLGASVGVGAIGAIGSTIGLASEIGALAGLTVRSLVTRKDLVSQRALQDVGGVVAVGEEIISGRAIKAGLVRGLTDPIGFTGEMVGSFYAGGKIAQGVGVVAKPLTNPLSAKLAKYTTREVVAGSERFIFKEPRLITGSDTFRIVGEGKVSFATQSKLGAYLYKRGFEFAKPKTVLGKTEYAFNVKEIYSTKASPIVIKQVAQGTDDVTSYLIAKEVGVQKFGKVPKSFEKVSFKTGYVDKLTEEAFGKLAVEKVGLAETFGKGGRTGFETEGIIKTSIGVGKKKVVSDVILEKTTSDVFGLGKTKLKVGFEKQFVESPLISKVSTKLGVVEEKGIAKVGLRYKGVEGGVGEGSQIIKLEGGGSGVVELKTFSPETKFVVKDTASASVYSEYLGAKEKYQSLLGKEKPLQRYVSTVDDFGERNVLQTVADKRFVPEGKFEVVKSKPSILKGFKQKVSDLGFKIKNIKEYYTLRKNVGLSEKDALYNIKTQQVINKQIRTTYPKGIPIDKTLKEWGESGIKARNEQLALERTITIPKEPTPVTTKTTTMMAKVSVTPKVVQTAKTQTTQALQTQARTQYQQSTQFFRTYGQTVPKLKLKQETISLPSRQDYKLDLKSDYKVSQAFASQQKQLQFQKISVDQKQKTTQIIKEKQSTKTLQGISIKQDQGIKEAQIQSIKQSQLQSYKQSQLQLQKQAQLQSYKQSQLQLQKQAQLQNTNQLLKQTTKQITSTTTKIKTPTTPRYIVPKYSPKQYVPKQPKRYYQPRIKAPAKKTKPLFQLKSDFFRRFATAETNLSATKESIKLRNTLWKRQGSFISFIPTKQLLSRNYINKVGLNSGKGLVL